LHPSPVRHSQVTTQSHMRISSVSDWLNRNEKVSLGRLKANACFEILETNPNTEIFNKEEAFRHNYALGEDGKRVRIFIRFESVVSLSENSALSFWETLQGKQRLSYFPMCIMWFSNERALRWRQAPGMKIGRTGIGNPIKSEPRPWDRHQDQRQLRFDWKNVGSCFHLNPIRRELMTFYLSQRFGAHMSQDE
jgi:hypothetical protein